jgi:hypothetical protein
VGPDVDDNALAAIMADYLTEGRWSPHGKNYYLSITHDVRSSALNAIAARRKYDPDFEPNYPVGPCPLHYDWQYSNTVGIKTKDSRVAKQWAIEAILLGYSVHWGERIGGVTTGVGTLAHVREKKKQLELVP